ncbi:MAG: tetratricopeptide repeat protein [Treponema sp.]|nr:tetratricopeptide repeat protein [Treponema sp.]
MSGGFVVGIILVLGIGFLVFFIVRNIILPKRASAAAGLLNDKNILQTMRTAKAAIDRNPQDAEAHYLLGKAYLTDKREELAFRSYRSASRLGIAGKNIPETEFRETIAYLYAKFNEEEEALKEYVLLIKQHPENPDYYFRAGKIFSKRNRADLAEQYLRKAVSLNPKSGIFRYELGMLYYAQKKMKEAVGEFDAAIKIDPTDNSSNLQMGRVLKDGKDFSGAIPFLEKASRDQEYKLKSLVELGFCYMSLKMMDKATQELERATAVITKDSDTDSLYARYFLGMCYEKNRDITKALAQWDKIYAVKKNFRDVGEKLTQYIEHRT